MLCLHLQGDIYIDRRQGDRTRGIQKDNEKKRRKKELKRHVYIREKISSSLSEKVIERRKTQ
jgi:hypothetical protein